jgi:6-pyruvoyltetrahydropterin/6-carboxytetrahydropterin synthase
VFHVCREIEFCYGHRLLHHDGKCRHLHGHNGKLLVTVSGDGLDELGMVVDFSEIKRVLSRWIEENLDHRMILSRDNPLVPVLQEFGEPLYLMDAHPTAENIAKLIFDHALNQGLSVVEVRFFETPTCSASYSAQEPT